MHATVKEEAMDFLLMTFYRQRLCHQLRIVAQMEQNDMRSKTPINSCAEEKRFRHFFSLSITMLQKNFERNTRVSTCIERYF